MKRVASSREEMVEDGMASCSSRQNSNVLTVDSYVNVGAVFWEYYAAIAATARVICECDAISARELFSLPRAALRSPATERRPNF